MKNTEYLLSFARRVGKKLSPTQKEILNKAITEKSADKLSFETNKSEVILEIGSGMGDFLSKLVLAEKNKMFIACEPYLNGLISLIQKSQGPENLYLWPDDARILLSKLPDHFIDTVYVLFPDPWPKKSHQKKRVINDFLLKLLHQKLKSRGNVKIATDDTNYAQWILMKFINCGLFEWKARNNFHAEFAEFTQTKYYKRSINKPYFFEFFSC